MSVLLKSQAKLKGNGAGSLTAHGSDLDTSNVSLDQIKAVASQKRSGRRV